MTLNEFKTFKVNNETTLNLTNKTLFNLANAKTYTKVCYFPCI